MKALVASVPVGALLAYAGTVFVKHRTVSTLLRLVGTTCLLLMVFTHVAEALQLLPAMRWGEPDSPGHYVDLSSAVLGVTLTPIGYLLHRREGQAARLRSGP